MRTHASSSYSFGNQVHQIEYINIFQDSLSLFLSCRYVTLRSSYTILVSERDTPILILSWCRNVTPDPYSILVPERGTRSPNLTTFVHQAFFYTKASSLTKQIRVSFQDLGFNSFIMLIYSQLHNHIIHASIQLSIQKVYNTTNTYHSLLRVYYEQHENHNLPPPKISDQASKFSPKLCVSPSRSSLSLSIPFSLFLFFSFSYSNPLSFTLISI